MTLNQYPDAVPIVPNGWTVLTTDRPATGERGRTCRQSI